MAKHSMRFFLEQLTVDPTQYKPYSHVLKPDGAVLVELAVDDETIVEYSDQDDVVVLNLDGFKAILKQVADAVEDAHIERQTERSERYARASSPTTQIVRTPRTNTR